MGLNHQSNWLCVDNNDERHVQFYIRTNVFKYFFKNIIIVFKRKVIQDSKIMYLNGVTVKNILDYKYLFKIKFYLIIHFSNKIIKSFLLISF